MSEKVKEKLSLVEWIGLPSETDFSKFGFFDNNRQVDDDHVDFLKQKIIETGMITPIVVVDIDGELKVVDGQHRLEAAKELSKVYSNILVPFVSCKIKNDIYLKISGIQNLKRWSLQDMLSSRAGRNDMLSKKVLEIYNSQSKEKLRYEDILSLMEGKNWSGTKKWFEILSTQKVHAKYVLPPANKKSIDKIHKLYNDLIIVANRGARHPKMTSALIQFYLSAKTKEENANIIEDNYSQKLLDFCQKIKEDKVFRSGQRYDFPLNSRTAEWKDIFSWIVEGSFPSDMEFLD